MGTLDVSTLFQYFGEENHFLWDDDDLEEEYGVIELNILDIKASKLSSEYTVLQDPKITCL